MTLVLSATWRSWAIHASDRLTTIPKTPKNLSGEWDLHSNKTVVVLGTDCWLVLGYSGLAYLDERTTDQFIAEKLTGYTDLTGAMSFLWMPGEEHRYEPMTRRLRDALADAYTRLPTKAREHATTVAGVGWVQRGETPQRVLFNIKADKNGSSFHLRTKNPLPVGDFQVNGVGYCYENILEAANARLSATENLSPEIFRDILMDAVQQTGQVSDAVGEDVMGVILDPTNKRVNAHFRSADPMSHDELVRSMKGMDEESAELPSVETPYLLVPGMCFGPSAGTGGWTLFPSGINFDVTGFAQEPTPGRAWFGAHPRRRQPRPGD